MKQGRGYKCVNMVLGKLKSSDTSRDQIGRAVCTSKSQMYQGECSTNIRPSDILVKDNNVSVETTTDASTSQPISDNLVMDSSNVSVETTTYASTSQPFSDNLVIDSSNVSVETTTYASTSQPFSDNLVIDSSNVSVETTTYASTSQPFSDNLVIDSSNVSVETTTYASTSQPFSDNLIVAETSISAVDSRYCSDSSVDYYSDSDKENFIVSESECHSDDSDFVVNVRQSPKKSRKRKSNPVNWKCNQRKVRRSAGLAYVSKKNKQMPAKVLKPSCLPSCSKKCTEKISSNKRQEILNNFYREDFNNDLKRLFVANRITKSNVERRRSRTGDRESKRNHTLNYTFNVNNTVIPVCKTFFLNTLNISQSFIEVALKKINDGGTVECDKRGKHPPVNKLDQVVRKNIKKHIESFPVYESHYSREKSSRKYLGNELSIKKMYELYIESCKENSHPPEKIAKQWVYYETFNNEYNYSFKQPANDTCDTCDSFEILIKESTSAEQQLAQIDFDQHLMEAQKRYKSKALDKEVSKSDKTKKVIMVDLQKCLPTPLLTNSQTFYLRKLWTFNLTIYDATLHRTTSSMWDETVAGRGASEIASCINKWASTNLSNDVQELTIWSDNCGGQNRNYIMIMFYFWLLNKNPNLQIINHKFLLKGHTHMEVDGQHGIIERAKRKTKAMSVVIPWDWQQLVRSCSTSANPMEVSNMQLSDFFNFKLLSEGTNAPFIIRKKNIKISEMVHIQVRASDIGVLFFKTNFEDPTFQRADFCRTSRRNGCPVTLPALTVPRSISTQKYKDLQTALQWIPTCFHDFYKSISHETQVPDFPES